jgi:hypothetical protein
MDGSRFSNTVAGASTSMLRRPCMTEIATVGLDLAKSWFQVHGADAQGRPILRKKLPRAKVLAFFASLPPCLVGMEACGSAHPYRPA